ncbi:16S rRNA methyltransferase [Salipiger aestuarii]|uniref:16S rRNA (Cytosine967-C5)-methyltransferase n=1 Tax=Salipiger aestuarii TaxID=568098 RepID=A0A327YS11_9RHOB|nr:transcription antitermination factor NusB [Salipiger aestuarii]EIE49195.1 rRNA methyltransferase RsmB [Citreicella sp. 357]KAA8609721.1 16S rRNA methyltransferase [Salipiger aestuarii]KAA8614052.1 16S rRNA methyltransferase [Salipiger aestuarii]KAB2543653.1 16S rRNA methyltransferase [Salipiger aestuarii]RAK22887.1 16S rRNA (cytosine967-C5)-methyltransferase [Salipiger aestuarii]
MAAIPSARAQTVHLLGQVLGQGRGMSDAMSGPAWRALPPADRAAAQRMAQDVLRTLDKCDRVLKPHLRKAPPLFVHNVLRLGAFELCTGGAAHGVVNEAVRIVGADRKTQTMKGMVNAVLRKVAEDGPEHWDKLRAPRLPRWLRDPLVAAWGARPVTAMEAAHYAGAPLDLTPRDDAQRVATATGGVLLPTGSVRLMQAGQVSALPGFDAGEWWVQDAAAALPVRLLGDVTGLRVLDMCAAPGGKTMQLAAAGADVTALDISASRMARVTENLARTGLSANIVTGNVLEHEGRYDAIVLDAPCSATGTIRRHPDLPHARQGEGISELIALQAAMIDHALGLLAPGGRMVFCTCSLIPDEGECQIEEALVRHPDLTILPAQAPGLENAWRSDEGGVRLRPDFWAERGGMDGFYMAVLHKPG